MGNVRSINAHKNDAALMTPTDALREALSDIQKGIITPNKLIVVALDDTDGMYSTRFVQANMKMSEIVALLEVMKHNIITDQMGL